MKENFERCLAYTLKWEGGYSNHPDDPGGATMKGVTQAVYDAWRGAKRSGHPFGNARKSVRHITEVEIRAIYRERYWDACGCDDIPAGLDLCVFDAAVNSGPARAKRWLEAYRNIDDYQATRLGFVQSLRTWRVFGRGWSRRIKGVTAEAKAMAGGNAPEPIDIPDITIHAGMKGDAVRRLQVRLRALGYPAGAIDGIFGEQTYRAVLIFQEDHELAGDKGVWLPEYESVLDKAPPMLPKRKEATAKDLESQGDRPVKRMNLLQRIFAWIFGASAVAQVTEGTSVVETVGAAKSMFEPVSDLVAWAASNKLILICAGCIAVIALVRLIRARHVDHYRHFDYQGEFKEETA